LDRTRLGQAERRALLKDVGIFLPDDLGEADHAES
jgi:hypothetical protein